ncbi:MAG TPA: hypothetical protein VF757_08320 [Sphingomicrobium sp.]
MKSLTLLLLLASASPVLTGCVPMMAASAVSMAAQGSHGEAAGNEDLQAKARDACTERASQYGAVHVNVVEQRKADQIIVWGTVDDGKESRSFECDFGTQITGFTLRRIAPAS